MAIILADFPLNELGIYGTNDADVTRVWDGYWTSYGNYATAGTDTLAMTSVNGHAVFRSAGRSTADNTEARIWKDWAGHATAGIALKLWMPYLPYRSQDGAGAGEMFVNFAAGSTDKVCVRLGCDGSLYVMDPDPSGTVIGTSAPCIKARAQHHIEIKVTIGAGSTDTIAIRVDGVEVLSLTGANFEDTNITRIEIGSAYSRGTSGEQETLSYYNSVIIWDGSGSANNDWLGPNVCYHTLYPDGDAALNWTPSTGATGFDLIDDDEPGDTDYVYATSTAASATDFTFENPSNLATVNAVLAIGRASKTDAGGGSIQISLSPNGTNWDAGQTKALPENNFNYWYDVSEASPATAVAWTASEINSLEMRVDRTA